MQNNEIGALFEMQIPGTVESPEKFAIVAEQGAQLLARRGAIDISLWSEGGSVHYKYRNSKGSINGVEWKELPAAAIKPCLEDRICR